MTWTTLIPDGATMPVAAALIVVNLLALACSLGLLHRVLKMRRLGRIPAEGLDEDREGEDE